MIGRRTYPEKETWVSNSKPGDYWKDERAGWMAKTPNGLIGNLANHQVIEHEDGTITVSPSILIDCGDGLHRWHGYLEKGVWREA